MGFFNDFAQGFFSTSAETVQRRRDLQDKLDFERAKAIAQVDPTVEVFKRQKEIELDLTRQRQKDNLDMVGNLFGNTGDASVKGQTIDNTDPAQINKMLQDALDKKGRAEAAGNKELTNFFDTKAEQLKAQYTFAIDQTKAGSKPVTGAEGSNPVEMIQKQLDTDLKNRTQRSRYAPEGQAKFIADPEVVDMERQSNMQHQALAQAVASVQSRDITRVTPEVSAKLISDTEQMVRNLNTLRSDAVSPKQKQEAAANLKTLLDKIAPPNTVERERLLNDPNFTSVIDEQTLSAIDNAQAPAKSGIPVGAIVRSKTDPKKRMQWDGTKWNPL